jgi:hypothetical protein
LLSTGAYNSNLRRFSKVDAINVTAHIMFLLAQEEAGAYTRSLQSST